MLRLVVTYCLLPVIAVLFLIPACTAPEASRPYFSIIAANDQPLGEPQPGEWRYEQHETPQSFDDYSRTIAEGATDSQQLTILPVGTFNVLQLELLNDLASYCRVFFQREARVLPPIPESAIPATARRRREDGHEQFLSRYIIDSLLPPFRSRNNFAVMAITATDLYPEPDWNFVFGQASYSLQVGVTSIYRLQDDSLSKSNYARALLLLNKVGSHEIGHMLSLAHCQNAQCVMNGSNNFEETDRQPARACSECQEKLHRNLGFPPERRLQQLTSYFRKHSHYRELSRSYRDLDSLKASRESK